MQKQQPSICVGDLSESEVYEWMKQKTRAIEQLKSACALRETIQGELDVLDERISYLTSAAALEYSTDHRAPVHPGIDERTLRDLAVLHHLLSKPTGDPDLDAKNAAVIERGRAAIREGKIIYLSALPDWDVVQQARTELGQVTGLA